MSLTRLPAILIALMIGASPLAAQQTPVPLLSGPWDPASTQSRINSVIRNINAILSPLQPRVTDAVNFISLTPAISGGLATIGLGTDADTNAGIRINPNGSGNIELFAQADTGVLKIANETSFIKVVGLGTCPSVGKNRPLGVSDNITGFFVMKDWLDRTRYVPSC